MSYYFNCLNILLVLKYKYIFKKIQLIFREDLIMCKVISFYNNKGGVGKTTILLNLAHALQQRNNKILVIDNDPQSNTTLLLSPKTEDELSTMNTIYELLVEKDTNTQDCILPSLIDNIDIISCTIDHIDTSEMLYQEPNNRTILRRKLFPILNNYDFILIDNAPASDLTVMNALFASNIILTPIETQIFSHLGLKNLLTYINRVTMNNTNFIAHYTFINKIDNRRKTNNTIVIDSLKRFLLDTLLPTHIPVLSSFAKSIDNGATVFQTNDKRAQAEINALTNALLQKIEEDF